MNIIKMSASDRVFRPVRHGLNYRKVNETGLDKYNISASNTDTLLDSTVQSSVDRANINVTIDPPLLTANSDFNPDPELDSVFNLLLDQPDISIDSSDTHTQSFNLSIDPFDSVSQTLPAIYLRRGSLPACSWVFEHFQVAVVEGRFFTPKHTNIRRPEQRFSCKHCSYVQLDSKHNGTSNFIKHLSVNHRIHKASASVSGPSVVDLLRNAPSNISIPSVSPRQSVID
jgi:hypothetical protein